MRFGGFLLVFLGLALAERLVARRFSAQATRGSVKVKWTSRALDGCYLLIYLGTGLEYFLVDRPLLWPVTSFALAGYLVSLVVRRVAIHTLGRYWSLDVEIREGHKLVRGGIYQYLRHPVYAVLILEVICLPLVGNCYFTALFSLVVYVPLILARFRREEQEMIHKFGDQYRRYRQAVPAFVPGAQVLFRRPDANRGAG